MRVLAIGDIHGSKVALDALLQQVQPGPKDQLVFLGDYIDRGPASREVVDTLLQLKQRCATIFLRGNHESMILDALDGALKSDTWQSCGGLETLYSYNAAYQPDWTRRIPTEHWEFFARTDRFFENGSNIFVHAGLDPELSLDEQPDWLLCWEYFDRIRPHKSGKRIICGHTTQRSGVIKNVGFAVCIDTGAAVGGWLTCLDVNSGDFWQANENGKRRKGILEL